MKDTEYAYAVSHIRAHENALLSNAELEQLISEKSAKDALRILTDKGFNIDNFNSVNEMLNEKLLEAYTLIEDSAPDEEELKILTVRNDFNNLKAALKSLAADTEPSSCYMFPTTLDLEEMYKALADKRYFDLPIQMQYIARKAYDILIRSMDAQRCDVCVDKFTLRSMQEIANKAKNDFISRYVDAFVALTDIKTAYRCAKTKKHHNFIYDSICGSEDIQKEMLIAAAEKGVDALLEYLEKTSYRQAALKLKESTEAFERYSDDVLMQIVKDAKLKAFGIEPLLAYYLAMETQIKCLRIILECKAMGVSEDAIRERMRELYV